MTEYVEKPIRNKKSMYPWRKVLTLLCATLITVVSFSIYTIVKVNATHETINQEHPGAMSIVNNEKQNYTDFIPNLAKAPNDSPVSYSDGSNQLVKKKEVLIGEYGKITDYKHTVILAGASHTTHYLGAITSFAEDEDIRLITVTKSGCRLTTEIDPDDSSCNVWKENAFKKIVEYNPDLVITLGTITKSDNSDYITKGMIDYFHKFNKENIKVMATRDTPRFKFSIPEMIESKGVEKTKAIMNQYPLISDQGPWENEKKIPSNVTFVDYSNFFMVNGEYSPVIGGVIVYHDKAHISNTYSESLGPIVKEDIQKIIEQ